MRNGLIVHLLQFLALFIGGCLSVLIIYLGHEAMLISKVLQLPRLMVQSLGLYAIGGICFLGIVASAFIPRVLEKSLWLRRGLICVAFALPAVDFFALWNDGDIASAIGGHALISIITSSLISLAIATAWIDCFRNPKKWPE